MVLFLSNALTISIAFNVWIYFKLKKEKKAPQESYEVTQLLQDLTQGAALIKIERLDPASVFLRSPRERA